VNVDVGLTQYTVSDFLGAYATQVPYLLVKYTYIYIYICIYMYIYMYMYIYICMYIYIYR